MYPSLILKNQFGEQSNNAVIGGSFSIPCNFIVDSTNGNGLGIRSLKGPAIASVFMSTQVTPAPGNPQPAAGIILINFVNPYSYYVGGYAGMVRPLSGTVVLVTAGLVVGVPYVITTVGTTTPAQWQALGFPVGYTPAVGASFIATTVTPGVGTGAVESTATTGVSHFEVLGNPNLMLNPGGGLGGQMILGTIGSGAFQPQAPADGTVIGLTFEMTPVPSELI